MHKQVKVDIEVQLSTCISYLLSECEYGIRGLLLKELTINGVCSTLYFVVIRECGGECLSYLVQSYLKVSRCHEQ